MKKILFFVFFVQISILNAQFSLNGGISTLKAFGVPKPYVGIHLGAEIPRDNEVSFYLRGSFYAKNELDPTLYYSPPVQLTANDPNDFTYATANTRSFFNYKTFDGGIRYYIMDGYDNGFALYGGSNVMGIINKAKVKVDDFDHSKYHLPTGYSVNGTVLNLGVGFSGGAKYTYPGIGSIYFDMTLDYIIIGLPSNLTAQTIANNCFSPLLFSFNIGFRRDFY